MTIISPRGIFPIGSVLGYLKSFTNNPTLDSQGRNDWVEVNGATISDTESPINGQTLPDLNGNNYFLRGADTSGGTGGANSHCHCYGYSCEQVDADLDGSYNCAVDSCLSGSYNSQNNIPPYYDVVYICRIK